jgi:hypothetical protein
MRKQKQDPRTDGEAKLGMAMGRVRIMYSNYLSVSKEDVGRNSYPYPYTWIEIYTRTCWILGGYRVPVGFVISHIKTISK